MLGSHRLVTCIADFGLAVLGKNRIRIDVDPMAVGARDISGLMRTSCPLGVGRTLLMAAQAGVAALFGLSALGGIGGDSGRSMWWAVLLVPYVTGWVLALVESVRVLREQRA